MRVILIRHGATAGNLKGQYIGVTEEPLCLQGIAALKQATPWYPPVSGVVSSPMRRCIETAALLYPQLSPQIISELRECDFGQFEGKTYEQLKHHPVYQKWLKSGGMIGFPGGESRGVFCTRCQKAFLSIAENQTKGIAIVTHGGVIMALLEAFYQGTFYDWQTKNGGGYAANWDGRRLRDVRPLFPCNNGGTL